MKNKLKNLRTHSAEHVISYDTMLEEVDKGKTDIEIGKKYGFQRSTIGTLRRKYKIKSKFPKSYSNQLTLTVEQCEIILGSILGKGDVRPSGNLKITHRKENYPYISWLRDKLKPFSSILDQDNDTFSFSTKPLDFIKDLYQPSSSEQTKDILWKLTPLSLAVWFMDNGGLTGNGGRSFLSINKICPKSESEIVVDYFKQKWDVKITTHVHNLIVGSGSLIRNNPSVTKFLKTKTSGLYFYIDSENSFKLAEIIKYHLLPSMLHKLPEDARKHIVYLAGGMQSAPDGGVKWRRNFKSLLNRKGYYCIDPTNEEKHFLFDEGWKNMEKDFPLFQKNMRKIIKADLHYVHISGVIICLYDEFLGGGSFHECGESYLKGKKLYIININKVPLPQMSWWVLGCATKVVNSYKELLDVLPDLSD